MKKVLVTGGAGFIGSHLIDVLVARGAKVIIVDNLSSGHKENIAHHIPRKAEFILGDVTNQDLINQLVKKADTIFHTAALNLKRSLDNPLKDLATNTQGTLNILQAIQQLNPRAVLVYSSTGSVYGEPVDTPQDENHPLKPVSPYGISKLAAEQYVLLWTKLYRIKTVALRYFNVYGPRQNFDAYGGVVSIFISRALRGLPLVIEGDGKQTRSFTSVHDVVKANLLAAKHKSKWGEVYNIASGETTNILQLAKMISRLCKALPKLKFAPPRPGDIKEVSPDISKSQRHLKFSPKIGLEEGLTELIKWFKNRKR